VNLELRSYAEQEAERLNERRLDRCLQIAIAVLSIAAAYMVASEGPWQRWGFVVGLLSQPFYFAATWRARQYGMLIVAIFYVGAWVQGIANRFTF
jgi:hypothetical protein